MSWKSSVRLIEQSNVWSPAVVVSRKNQGTPLLDPLAAGLLVQANPFRHRPSIQPEVVLMLHFRPLLLSYYPSLVQMHRDRLPLLEATVITKPNIKAVAVKRDSTK